MMSLPIILQLMVDSMNICLLIALLICSEYMLSCECKLYMNMEYPIKDNASTSSINVADVSGNVQCAGLCDIDSNNCKAFSYQPSTQICQLVNFQFSNPEVVITSGKRFGHVEHVYAVSFISRSFFNTKAAVSSDIWARYMYQSLNLTDYGSLLQCMILCYQQPKCKVLVFHSPICFLGDSIVKGKFPTAVETETLYTNFVDGNWGSWTSYSTCTLTCGGGTQFRTRACDSPAPLNGGLDCQGVSIETPKCNEQACPVLLDIKTQAFGSGDTTLSCNPGYYLLSCGLANTQTSQAIGYRWSIPFGNSCKCSDVSGALCVAMCTNNIVGFQTVAMDGTNYFSVSCPSGKKVLGCHILPSYQGFERWPHFYPSADGSRCECYYNLGASCIATCGSNLIDYEVIMASGANYLTTTCSPNNYVLGCGSQPVLDRGPENFRTAYTKTTTSCECYDYFGMICYAICGKLSWI